LVRALLFLLQQPHGQNQQTVQKITRGAKCEFGGRILMFHAHRFPE